MHVYLAISVYSQPEVGVSILIKMDTQFRIFN